MLFRVVGRHAAACSALGKGARLRKFLPYFGFARRRRHAENFRPPEQRGVLFLRCLAARMPFGAPQRAGGLSVFACAAGRVEGGRHLLRYRRAHGFGRNFPFCAAQCGRGGGCRAPFRCTVFRLLRRVGTGVPRRFCARSAGRGGARANRRGGISVPQPQRVRGVSAQYRADRQRGALRICGRGKAAASAAMQLPVSR